MNGQINNDRPEFCHWTFDDNEFAQIWEGACGAAWSFNEGGPHENNFRFCPKCGGTVVIDPKNTDNDGTALPEQAQD